MIALTTCVDYDDYLSVTLPFNKRHFSNTYVVTTPDDHKTRQVCEQNDVNCILTNVFYENGSVFNKGKAINEGLDILKECSQSWICHIDADIIIPNWNITDLQLDTNTIYGCPRLMCPSKDAWQKYLSTASTKKWQQLKPSYFQVDNKIINQYLPLGYFQLFNLKYLTKPYYPEDSNDASTSDLKFALKWKNHHCLDNFVIHLPQIGSTLEGINWRGRKSPRFQ